MNTPYLVVKECLPCGRQAWRRMVNPCFSQVPAIEVAYLQLNLKPVDFPRQVVHHKPKMVFGENLVLPNLVVNLPRQE